MEQQAAKEKKRKAKERRMLEQTVTVSEQHVSAATASMILRAAPFRHSLTTTPLQHS